MTDSQEKRGQPDPRSPHKLSWLVLIAGSTSQLDPNSALTTGLPIFEIGYLADMLLVAQKRCDGGQVVVLWFPKGVIYHQRTVCNILRGKRVPAAWRSADLTVRSAKCSRTSVDQSSPRSKHFSLILPSIVVSMPSSFGFLSVSFTRYACFHRFGCLGSALRSHGQEQYSHGRSQSKGGGDQYLIVFSFGAVGMDLMRFFFQMIVWPSLDIWWHNFCDILLGSLDQLPIQHVVLHVNHDLVVY